MLVIQRIRRTPMLRPADTTSISKAPSRGWEIRTSGRWRLVFQRRSDGSGCGGHCVWLFTESKVSEPGIEGIDLVGRQGIDSRGMQFPGRHQSFDIRVGFGGLKTANKQ